MGDSRLMTYNTFTLKQGDAATYSFFQIWTFLKNSKKWVHSILLIIVFGISKECSRPQNYLNTKSTCFQEVPRGNSNEREN